MCILYSLLHFYSKLLFLLALLQKHLFPMTEMEGSMEFELKTSVPQGLLTTQPDTLRDRPRRRRGEQR